MASALWRITRLVRRPPTLGLTENVFDEFTDDNVSQVILGTHKSTDVPAFNLCVKFAVSGHVAYSMLGMHQV